MRDNLAFRAVCLMHTAGGLCFKMEISASDHWGAAHKSVGTFRRGQTAVLFALIAAVLIGAIALGTDVAAMYVNWQQTQKVADAAALAGANYLAGYTFNGPSASGCGAQSDAAKTVACTYAVDNGLPAGDLTITEPTSSSIQVIAQQTGLPFYFGKVLGLSTYAVTASAKAAAGGSVCTALAGGGGNNTPGMFPVGLQCTAPCNLSTLDPGQSVSFGSKFAGGLAPGNWQFLDVSGGSGGGDALLANGVQYGVTTPFSIGSAINSEPGNKGNSGPVRSALTARLSSCPAIADPCAGGGNPNNIPPGDPCLILVPAVDFNGCTGSCNLTIEGFAEIYLEQTSTGTNIQGCLVQSIAPNTLASCSGAPSLGAYQVPTLSQ